MSAENVLSIVDEATGRQIERCAGPAADGSCPRVTIGDILPCSGHVIVPVAPGEGAFPYAVSGTATLCPVTVAAALAVTPDNLLWLTPPDKPERSPSAYVQDRHTGDSRPARDVLGSTRADRRRGTGCARG